MVEEVGGSRSMIAMELAKVNNGEMVANGCSEDMGNRRNIAMGNGRNIAMEVVDPISNGRKILGMMASYKIASMGLIVSRNKTRTTTTTHGGRSLVHQ